MQADFNHRYDSPAFERYVLDLLERSKRAITKTKASIDKSKKLEESCAELLDGANKRRAVIFPQSRSQRRTIFSRREA